MSINMYDVIIIGAGPAGLTAAIYTSRRALNTLVLSSDIGGQVSKTYDIENYPGIDRISGAELSMKLRSQAENFGVKIVLEEATQIKKVEDYFEITTNLSTHQAKSIILAFGKKPRELNVPGERELKGRGVTYCATCDAPFFKNKNVAIAGGGNSALDAAILAAKLCRKVYLIHRGPEFRGEQYLIDKVKEIESIEVILNNEIAAILGEKVVSSIKLKSGEEIEVNGVMVEIGYVVDRSLVENLVEVDERNQVIVNDQQETSLSGVFAAGDLTPTPFKQIVISAGEGAKAALACFNYLQRKNGKRSVISDWH